MHTPPKTTPYGHRLFVTRQQHGISRFVFPVALVLALSMMSTSQAQSLEELWDQTRENRDAENKKQPIIPGLLEKSIEHINAENKKKIEKQIEILKKARAYIGLETEIGNIEAIEIKTYLLPILKDGREISKEYGDKHGLTQYSNITLRVDRESYMVRREYGYRQVTYRKINNKTTDLKVAVVGRRDYKPRVASFGKPNKWIEYMGAITPLYPNIGTEFLDAKIADRFRAIAHKELSLYRGLESSDFTVKDLGVVLIDGISCRKVSFSHEAIGTTYEYFEEATGRPVMVEGVDGSIERVVSMAKMPTRNIRYPREVIITPANLPADSPFKQLKAVSTYTYLSDASGYNPYSLDKLEYGVSAKDVYAGNDMEVVYGIDN